MTEGTVHERMARVAAALSHIPKQRSEGVNYQFRSIDAVMNALHGPLTEHGLYLSPRVLDDWRADMIPGTNNRQQTQALFRVEIDVWAEDGSHVTLGPGLAQSHDYGDKAVYQAQQNAIKYLLLTAFCIPTAEADMDAREPDAVPAQRPASEWSSAHQKLMDDLESLLAEASKTATDRERFNAWAANSRTYAGQGEPQAREALATVRKLVAERQRGDLAISAETLADVQRLLGEIPDDRRDELAEWRKDNGLDADPEKLTEQQGARLASKLQETIDVPF